VNNRLTEEIAYHILANLGVLPSEFVNSNTTKSVIDKQFLLADKIVFQLENQTVHRHVYGCHASVAEQDFRIVLADCTQEKNVPEFAVIIQPPKAPTYGLYLAFNRLVENPPEAEAIIAIKSDKHWIPCTAFLQGTFLAGMEQLRDQVFNWKKLINYQTEYQHLLTFIGFHTNYYGVFNEGQES
jgi:hypothetical protein